MTQELIKSVVIVGKPSRKFKYENEEVDADTMYPQEHLFGGPIFDKIKEIPVFVLQNSDIFFSVLFDLSDFDQTIAQEVPEAIIDMIRDNRITEFVLHCADEEDLTMYIDTQGAFYPRYKSSARILKNDEYYSLPRNSGYRRKTDQ